MNVKFLLCLLLAVTASASNSSNKTQNGSPYELKKHVISAGGAVMTTNQYRATTTTGQVDAGLISSSSQYQAYGGFWTTSQGGNDLIFKDGFD